MVPTDGSEWSRHAIPLALAVARPANAVVHLVAVMEEVFVAPIYGVPIADVGWTHGMLVDPEVAAETHAVVRAEQESALHQFAERLAADAGVRVTASLEDGDVAAALRRYAESRRIDLIAMATHGRGAVRRALLGSIADTLVRSASCPVLLARPHGELAHEAEPAKIAHMLVPIDRTPESESIVAHAVAVAALAGARCTLLHVSHSEMLSGIPAPDALLDPVAVERSEAADEARLDRVAEPFRARSLSVSTVLLRVNDPAGAILDYAGAHAVDLVAMTTRAQHGLARIVRGSTATTILEKTMLPLLLVRADMPAA